MLKAVNVIHGIFTIPFKNLYCEMAVKALDTKAVLK